MKKFISYEKLSKKEKRKMDLEKRQTWGELNPVTRKPEILEILFCFFACLLDREHTTQTNSGLFL